MFSGRFIERKNPLFTLELTTALRSRLGREISLLFVGKGPLEKEMRNQAQRSGIRDCCFNGFASQDELPSLYASTLIFLFPSLSDPWGVVANEACAAGLPVISTPYAGVSGELVREGENGHVCELDIGLWIDRIVPLLEDTALYDRYCKRSREIVSEYTYERAATGIAQAVRGAVNQKGKRM
jgi:glycosyltransferase involved in cell wall biosynthesis